MLRSIVSGLAFAVMLDVIVVNVARLVLHYFRMKFETEERRALITIAVATPLLAFSWVGIHHLVPGLSGEIVIALVSLSSVAITAVVISKQLAPRS